MNGPVTVVILNYNGRRHLDECLESVSRQRLDRPFHILLWDNGSSDDSVAHVNSRFPHIEVHVANENLGFARAMNAAVRQATTPWVVLLNNDVRVPLDWLQELVKAGEAAGPDVAAVGSRMVLYDRTGLANHVGGFCLTMGGGFDEGLFAPVASYDGRPDVYETGLACGGAMLVPRETFLSLGGFDESFFMYFEDADYCLRAWIQGHRILHAANAIVQHKLGGTAGELGSPFRLFWGQRNRMVMAAKTREWPRLPGAMLLACGWGLLQAVQFRGEARRAALRGTVQGLAAAMRAGAARKGVQAGRRRSDRHLLHRRVLVGLRHGLAEMRRLSGRRFAT